MRNVYSVKGNIVLINLNKGLSTRIDASAFGLANSINGTWRADYCKNTDSYRVTYKTTIKGKNVTLYLHRVVTGALAGEVVDHRDHDTLNNMGYNLRRTTHAINSQNRKGATRVNVTGIRGVTLYKKTGRYKARTEFNGNDTHLGYYDTPGEAENAVKTWRASLKT